MEPSIAVAGIVQAIELLSHKFQKLETAVEKMAEAVSRLAVMEERQLADRQAVERAFKELEAQRKRIDDLEKQLILSARTTVWFERALWGVAVVGMIAITKVKDFI